MLKTEPLQNAFFNSVNFSIIATGENGVIHLFNVGVERMVGYVAAEVLNKITPAGISDPREVIARAEERGAIDLKGKGRMKTWFLARHEHRDIITMTMARRRSAQ